MADANNPIRLAYDALWDTLETKSEFTDLFPNDTVHQVRYSSDLTYETDPDLETLAPADYPRCRITVEGAHPRMNYSSDSSALGVRLLIEVCTGHQMQERLMDALWAIYLGYSKWISIMRDSSTGVKWNSALCVADVHDDEITVTDRDRERNRGTNQWIAAARCTITFDFATTNLESQ